MTMMQNEQDVLDEQIAGIEMDRRLAVARAVPKRFKLDVSPEDPFKIVIIDTVTGRAAESPLHTFATVRRVLTELFN